jgi:DNA adenine methylase
MKKYLVPRMLANYPGNKSASGVYQFIINHIPAHRLRVELFLGSGIISAYLNKHESDKPESIGFDLYDFVIDIWNIFDIAPDRRVFDYLFNESYVEVIGKIKLFYSYINATDTFFYADPPYLKTTRGSATDMYLHEFTEKDHIDFLTHAKFYNQNIMISHYPCELYDDMLQGWLRKTFTTQTRGCPKTDAIYMNYDIRKLKLHTTRFAGENFTQRQMISRKASRWMNKLRSMSAIERQLIVDQIIQEFSK